MENCQDRNSSTVSVYRLQASSRESRPPRTAATTSALRRITHRLVPGAGKSAIVNGLPSGPMTYFTSGDGVLSWRTHKLSTTELTLATYAPRLKNCLSLTLQSESP